MDLSTFAGAGATALGLALVILYLFIIGKIHSDPEFRRVVAERDEWKATATTERQAATEVASAGSVTNQLLGAVVTLAGQAKAVPPPPGLTAKDVGL